MVEISLQLRKWGEIMNLEQFNSYDEKTKQLLSEDMFRLYTIIETHQAGIEELEIFADWHMALGKLGQDLKDLLIGIYPWNEFTYTESYNMDTKESKIISSNVDKYSDAKERLRLIRLSDEALRFVKFWNDEVHRRLD